MNVYESLLDVPVDEYLGDDHDDQDVPSGQVPHAPLRSLSLSETIVKPDPNLAVPFVYLKSGDKGPAVVALVRALSRAGYGAWKGKLFSNRLGIFATRNLNAFKRKHGLPANGIYDKATWRELAPYFDAYAIKYLLNAKAPPKPSRDTLMRNAFVAELMYLYNRRSLERYTQQRPGDIRKPPSGLDCSWSGEWAAKWAGLKSLSGFTRWGYGNTDSQIARFRRLGAVRLTLARAALGDPLYYGRGGDPSHVGYWLGIGTDGVARIWSFGSYPISIRDPRYRHDLICACDLMAGQ